jgi:hypothetical protein
MLVVLAFERLREENCKLKGRLCYIVRPCLKKETKKEEIKRKCTCQNFNIK